MSTLDIKSITHKSHIIMKGSDRTKIIAHMVKHEDFLKELKISPLREHIHLATGIDVSDAVLGEQRRNLEWPSLRNVGKVDPEVRIELLEDTVKYLLNQLNITLPDYLKK